MLKMILALDEQNLLGDSQSHNGLAWSVKEDLKHFMNTTLNHYVIYGRKTFMAMGKPLKNRHNVIVSKTLTKVDGCEVVNDLDKYLNSVKNNNEDYFICGGKSIYEKALKYCDEIILSRIEGKYNGDIYLNLDLRDFKIVNIDKRDSFEIQYYERIK